MINIRQDAGIISQSKTMHVGVVKYSIIRCVYKSIMLRRLLGKITEWV